ncbi:hypothetical protein PIROE2DRAFT_17631 [Piromyces sp. E2]|nr:hypothetical protein PIROE2DRAFT_17631 [Piromyces sp. E2]|eukprot:OUM57398.1 hypothetical protein PIROE2DRAFT_17631 [Piromyces sp. E2]
MTSVIYNSLKTYSLLLSSKNIIVIAQLKAKIQFESHIYMIEMLSREISFTIENDNNRWYNTFIERAPLHTYIFI